MIGRIQTMQPSNHVVAMTIFIRSGVTMLTYLSGLWILMQRSRLRKVMLYIDTNNVELFKKPIKLHMWLDSFCDTIIWRYGSRTDMPTPKSAADNDIIKSPVALRSFDILAIAKMLIPLNTIISVAMVTSTKDSVTLLSNREYSSVCRAESVTPDTPVTPWLAATDVNSSLAIAPIVVSRRTWNIGERHSQMYWSMVLVITAVSHECHTSQITGNSILIQIWFWFEKLRQSDVTRAKTLQITGNPMFLLPRSAV